MLGDCIFASRRVVNAQDIRIDKLERHCLELEKMSSTLEEERTNLEADLVKFRRQNIKDAPSGK